MIRLPCHREGFVMDAPHKVAVVVRDGFLPMELGLVHQIFGSAVASESGRPLYEVRTVGYERGSVAGNSDFTINVQNDLGWLEQADTVVVPASRSDENLRPGDEQVEQFRAAVPDRARIASICTGAFLLAAAGFLPDGIRATTHWMSSAVLQQRYPLLKVDDSVLYVDGGRVLTSAGEASGLDLCLHMVRSDFGSVVANNVARRTVVAPHRDGGQSQFIDSPITVADRIGVMSEIEPWLTEHLGDSFGLEELAASGAMSIRTLTRRFTDEVAMTPWQWVTRRRVRVAQQMLEQSDASVEEIAFRCGLGTSASLRRHFLRSVGLSPTAFRRAFRSVH